VLTHNVSSYDDTGATLEQDSETRTYLAADTSSLWLIRRLSQAQKTSSVTGGSTVTRTTSYSPNSVTGDIDSFTIEPSGDSTVYMKRTFVRLPNGQMQSITDSDAPGTHSRGTQYVYHTPDDGDGVYPSGVYDNLGNFTRIWRHPGWGMTTEIDDPNNLVSVAT
jgi:hypothetical protein